MERVVQVAVAELAGRLLLWDPLARQVLPGAVALEGEDPALVVLVEDGAVAVERDAVSN